MQPKLVLAPSGSGKTRACIAEIRHAGQANPLAQIWVVLPDRNQAAAFNRRLAREGGGLGVHLGTLEDLYLELLARAGRPVPLAPEPLIHRLTRTAIDALVARGELEHYRPIAWRPGLTQAVSDLFAEFKRARIRPDEFAVAVRDEGTRLNELAALYAEYQAALIRLEWADQEGLGWLAVEALEQDAALGSDWSLLIADGFDSFTAVSLKALELLAPRVGQLCLTLSGELAIRRPAYRRFTRTLADVESALAPDIETLPPHERAHPALDHLERHLFDPAPRGPNPGPAITWIEAQTARLEAREALRWIKKRIVRDGVAPDECAVIARDISPYRPFLREAATEFGLPLRFLGGEPLARNPVIAAILNLLGLPAQNWLRRHLLDALRTPYLDLTPFGLFPADAAAFDRIARHGQVIEGPDQWHQVLAELARPAPETGADPEDKLPDLPRGEEAIRLLQGLEALIGRVTPPAESSLQGYADWAQDLLFEENGLRVFERARAQEDTAVRDLAALTTFGQALRALVLAETTAGARTRVRYDEFLSDLRGTLDTTTFNPDDPRAWRQARIYVGNLNTTRGISYRAVAVLGLSEGILPAPVSEDPLLSDEERARLRLGGLPLEPSARSDQPTLFYEAATRASGWLLLTRPYLAADGEKWEPSPYWRNAWALFYEKEEEVPVVRVRAEDPRPLSDAASPLELLSAVLRARVPPPAGDEIQRAWRRVNAGSAVLRGRLAAEARGEYEGEAGKLSRALRARYDSAHVWSASRLETYGTCGYFFYVAAALGLERREAPKAGYDVAQLGLLLHKILERVYRETPEPKELAGLLASLPQIANEVFAAAPRDYGFRPTPLWEMERAELLADLAATIEALEGLSDTFRPFKFEQSYGFKGAPLSLDTPEGPLRFRGVIDRVDRNAAGELRIIDYKTGASGFDKAALVEGRRLQLPLYALAATRALRLGRVVDGFYWAIRKRQASSLQLGRFRHDTEAESLSGTEGAARVAEQHVVEYVRAIRAGRFPPEVKSRGCPEYCPATLFCWRYLREEI